MAGLDLTAASAALKEFYLPVIREQLNNSNVLSAVIEKRKDRIEGKRAVLSLHVSRNSGHGARAENGTLPTAGSQGYAEERVPVYYQYGRITVSGPTIAAMKSDKGSFTRAVESESKGVVNDVKRDVNRQRFGTSNGVVATCGTTSTSATIVLAATTSAAQLRQLAVGEVVDIGTVAAPTTIASARTITAVDTANKTITVSGATVSTTSSHFVFISGNGGAIGGVGQKEITGLQTIVAASGSLFNVDPSTYPVWKSYVASNSGVNRTPTDSIFEAAIDEIEIASGKQPDLIVTSHGVRRAYGDSLKSQKRFANTTELKGGFKAVTVETPSGEVGLIADRDAPANKAFVLNTQHLNDDVMEDWNFMDMDGAVLSRVSGTDGYEATLFSYFEQTTDQRNAHGLISDLSGD